MRFTREVQVREVWYDKRGNQGQPDRTHLLETRMMQHMMKSECCPRVFAREVLKRLVLLLIDSDRRWQFFAEC